MTYLVGEMGSGPNLPWVLAEVPRRLTPGPMVRSYSTLGLGRHAFVFFAPAGSHPTAGIHLRVPLLAGRTHVVNLAKRHLSRWLRSKAAKQHLSIYSAEKQQLLLDYVSNTEKLTMPGTAGLVIEYVIRLIAVVAIVIAGWLAIANSRALVHSNAQVTALQGDAASTQTKLDALMVDTKAIKQALATMESTNKDRYDALTKTYLSIHEQAKKNGEQLEQNMNAMNELRHKLLGLQSQSDQLARLVQAQPAISTTLLATIVNDVYGKLATKEQLQQEQKARDAAMKEIMAKLKEIYEKP